MRLVFVAPFPPPVHGQSLVSAALADHLKESHDVECLNLGIATSNTGRITARRLIAVYQALRRLRRATKDADALYLTISESVGGNLKDLLIYAVSWRMLKRSIVHLHGGSIGPNLFDRHRCLKRFNSLFFRRLGGVVVSSDSHVAFFAEMIDKERIFVVPNFAGEHLFISEEAFVSKFSQLTTLRVLYLSAMTLDKGYQRLADSLKHLSEGARQMLRVDFAGRFPSALDEARFLETIADVQAVSYHGVVTESMKQDLFARTHLFCLPTSHREGQPIAIIEAYASGCVVMATSKPGILDIMENRRNGFLIDDDSPESIAAILESIVDNPEPLREIAESNRLLALARFRGQIYMGNMQSIIESVGSGEAPATQAARPDSD